MTQISLMHVISKNGLRYRLGYSGAPIGNGMFGNECSRDR